MNPGIRLTTSHIQTISEKQAAALMLLGYSNAELQAYMEEEALSNPFAEMEYPQEVERGSAGRIEKRDEGAREMAYRGVISGSEPEDAASQAASVWAILGEQLPAAEMTDQAWALAKTLAGYMDEDGYGMTDDIEVNIYGFIGRTGKVLVKFKNIKDDNELQEMRKEAESKVIKTNG